MPPTRRRYRGGRNDEDAWRVCNSTLQAWRNGKYATRFPGGEGAHELAARLRTALTRAVQPAFAGSLLVVAHGASIRAALPLLTGDPDPGHDLPTAGVARFDMSNNTNTGIS